MNLSSDFLMNYNLKINNDKPIGVSAEKEMLEQLNTIIDKLSSYDILDLIQKSYIMKFFCRTSLIKEDDISLNELSNKFSELYKFLVGLIMCFSFKGKEKCSYEKVLEFANSFEELSIQTKFKSYQDDKDFLNIQYMQSNITDLFGEFKYIPLSCIYSCEDSLLEEKYNTNCKSLLEDLMINFDLKLFNYKKIEKKITAREFYNDIEINFDLNELFIIPISSKNYKVCYDLSAKIGEFENEKIFNIESPISVLNIKRKLFIRIDSIIYTLGSDSICSRIGRCFN